MKKVLFTLMFIASLQLMCEAQNDIQFSNYMFSEITYNPAMAGISSTLDATLIGRQQWTGFSNAPQTELLSASTYLDKATGGVGISIVNDKLGFQHSLDAKLMYAYQLRLTDQYKLSLGLSFGFMSSSLQGSQLVYNDMTDPNDVLTNVNKTVPDFDFGVAVNSDKLSLGLSTTHIDQSLKNATVLNVPRHYYLYGAYKIKANDKINVIPSIKISSSVYITQFDLSVLMYYANKFWVGASYRLQDAVIGLVGVDITKNFRVGYSYDYNAGAVKTYSGGSHEIVLIGSFDMAKKVISSKTPRFFN